MKMEEDTELEEGEACFYKDDDNDNDLESLSYIVRVYLNLILSKFKILIWIGFFVFLFWLNKYGLMY